MKTSPPFDIKNCNEKSDDIIKEEENININGYREKALLLNPTSNNI